jgi:riboflavin synthase alpha subunit
MGALEKLRPGDTLSISGVCAQNVEVSETGATIDALRNYVDRVMVRGATISAGRDPSP